MNAYVSFCGLSHKSLPGLFHFQMMTQKDEYLIVDIPFPFITYPELNSCRQHEYPHYQWQHCFCSSWNYFETIQLQSSMLLHPLQTHLYREFHTIQLKKKKVKTPIIQITFDNVQIAITQDTNSIGTNSRF